MLRLQVDTKELMGEIENKILGLKELTAPTVLQELAKAVFTITGERFMIAADSYARRNPKKMHHVYEWGGIGSSSKRLFVLERERILGGDLIVASRFLSSRMPVPINPEMLSLGSTGKYVSKRSIFKDKATVMETGTAVSFTAKNILAFMGTEGMVFIAKGTQVNIAHPGGIGTANSFANFMFEWYTQNGSVVLESSGLYERIASETATVLNANKTGVTQVRQAVARVTNSVSGGKEIIL